MNASASASEMKRSKVITHGPCGGRECTVARSSGRFAAASKLLHKISTRWVFWAMLLAAAAYTPAVEYSTHVTSYLKEMVSSAGPAQGGFV